MRLHYMHFNPNIRRTALIITMYTQKSPPIIIRSDHKLQQWVPIERTQQTEHIEAEANTSKHLNHKTVRPNRPKKKTTTYKTKSHKSNQKETYPLWNHHQYIHQPKNPLSSLSKLGKNPIPLTTTQLPKKKI